MLSLALRRQSLSAHITAFRHILRDLLRLLGDPFQVVFGPFLVSLGVRNVLPGLLVRPRSSLNGRASETIRLMIASNSVAGIMRTQFSVNVNPGQCGRRPDELAGKLNRADLMRKFFVRSGPASHGTAGSSEWHLA